MGNAAGQGLAANLAPAAQAVFSGPQPAYVYDQTPNALGSYIANFFFDPNDAFTGDNPVDIFTGLDAEGEAIFGIQFMHSDETPNVYQIRGWAKAAEEEVYSNWVSIDNAAQNVQLSWQSDQLASAFLYVDGENVATLSADTSEHKLEEVRLGPSRGVEDTSGSLAASASGTMYFDEFVSFGTGVVMKNTLFLPMIRN